jgi:hypothetical protein
MLPLIDCSLSQALVLSEKWHRKKAAESGQMAWNAELEILAKSQSEKIAELETTYLDLWRGKENVTAG